MARHTKKNMTIIGLLDFQSIADVAGYIFILYIGGKMGIFLGEYFSTHPEDLWFLRVLFCIILIAILSWAAICFFDYTVEDFFKGFFWAAIPAIFCYACKICVKKEKK